MPAAKPAIAPKAPSLAKTPAPAAAPIAPAASPPDPRSFPASVSFSSATLKVASMRLTDDKVLVELLIEDSKTNQVLARPRLLVQLGKAFGISMGRNADLLDASGTVEKEIADDGRAYLRYRVEATPKSGSYFFNTGTWPVEARDVAR